MMKSMRLISTISAIALVLSLISCESAEKKAEKAQLKEAAAIHNQAIGIHNEVMPLFKEVETQKARINSRLSELGKAAKKDEAELAAYKHAFEALGSAEMHMREWMEALVEVPGNEEHHHHEHGEGHDHHHEHGAEPQLTAQQMLDVQKAALSSINDIKKETNEALTAARALK